MYKRAKQPVVRKYVPSGATRLHPSNRIVNSCRPPLQPPPPPPPQAVKPTATVATDLKRSASNDSDVAVVEAPPYRSPYANSSGSTPQLPAPPLDPKRRFCITASKVAEVIGTKRPEYCNFDKLIMGMIRGEEYVQTLFDNEAKKRMREGVLAEPEIANEFENEFNQKIFPTLKAQHPNAVRAILQQPTFKQHPELRFLGASADRTIMLLMTNGETKVIGLAEIKWRGGFRKNMPVNLQTYAGDRDYRDQCFLQMLCCDAPFNFLVVRSMINIDWWRYDWDDNWWIQHRDAIYRYYDDWLAWFWEDDRSLERTHTIRQYMLTHSFTETDVVKLFLNKPSDPKDILIMRQRRQLRIQTAYEQQQLSEASSAPLLPHPAESSSSSLSHDNKRPNSPELDLSSYVAAVSDSSCSSSLVSAHKRKRAADKPETMIVLHGRDVAAENVEHQKQQLLLGSGHSF